MAFTFWLLPGAVMFWSHFFGFEKLCIGNLLKYSLKLQATQLWSRSRLLVRSGWQYLHMRLISCVIKKTAWSVHATHVIGDQTLKTYLDMSLNGFRLFLCFSCLSIGMSKLNFKIIEISFHLLFDSDSFLTGFVFRIQSGLHRFKCTLVIATAVRKQHNIQSLR